MKSKVKKCCIVCENDKLKKKEKKENEPCTMGHLRLVDKNLK